MPLTNQQRVTLAAHVRANQDPLVVAALNAAGRNDTELTRLYNLNSTLYVWKESLTPAEYRDAIVWTDVDTLTNSKARIWEWMTQGMTSNIDASKANTRQGISDAFGVGSTTRSNLLAAAKMLATLAESLYLSGAGDGTEANPRKRTFTGKITTEDMGRALNEG